MTRLLLKIRNPEFFWATTIPKFRQRRVYYIYILIKHIFKRYKDIKDILLWCKVLRKDYHPYTHGQTCFRTWVLGRLCPGGYKCEIFKESTLNRTYFWIWGKICKPLAKQLREVLKVFLIQKCYVASIMLSNPDLKDARLTRMKPIWYYVEIPLNFIYTH